jgi:hydrogenase small subunit
MGLSRRRFLKYLGASVGVTGLSGLDVGLVRQALAAPDAPSVVWMHGSSCTGCSVSFLNRISDTAPETVADILTDNINLVYHPTIMSSSGDTAVAGLQQAYRRGGYILVLEGGVPMAFNGYPCIAMSYRGKEMTQKEAVLHYADRASNIVCVGTCASFGGIPASGSNPSGVVSVSELLDRQTINLPGCPSNPDWITWAIVQLLLENPVPLDTHGRPTALYEAHGIIHDSCPRWQGGSNKATDYGQAGKCLYDLGCRGPATKAHCENAWNGKAGQGRWCIGVNAPCHGCVEPTFPGPESFFEPYPNPA